MILQEFMKQYLDSKFINFIKEKLNNFNAVEDFQYSNLGKGSAKTLFCSMNSGFIYIFTYYPADETDDGFTEAFDFTVFNPKDVNILEQLLERRRGNG